MVTSNVADTNCPIRRKGLSSSSGALPTLNTYKTRWEDVGIPIRYRTFNCIYSTRRISLTLGILPQDLRVLVRLIEFLLLLFGGEHSVGVEELCCPSGGWPVRHSCWVRGIDLGQTLPPANGEVIIGSSTSTRFSTPNTIYIKSGWQSL